nr:hypothetical protein Ade03nite_65450 [Actinoplanes derwentensis]
MVALAEVERAAGVVTGDGAPGMAGVEMGGEEAKAAGTFGEELMISANAAIRGAWMTSISPPTSGTDFARPYAPSGGFLGSFPDSCVTLGVLQF